VGLAVAGVVFAALFIDAAALRFETRIHLGAPGMACFHRAALATCVATQVSASARMARAMREALLCVNIGASSAVSADRALTLGRSC
jgi:hypothetical protein